ncbi:MAG: helix-turn-helix transcriptional regulator [Clostridiales bacterium]|nr:helix-turn-helix transcriptional regulator [Clostridiales bacterium]
MVTENTGGAICENGVRVKSLRESRGLTQKELAEILDISRPALTKYERGERALVFAN